MDYPYVKFGDCNLSLFGSLQYVLHIVTLWPWPLIFWPLVDEVSRWTISTSSLVVLVSAVLVLSCGHTHTHRITESRSDRTINDERSPITANVTYDNIHHLTEIDDDCRETPAVKDHPTCKSTCRASSIASQRDAPITSVQCWNRIYLDWSCDTVN